MVIPKMVDICQFDMRLTLAFHLLTIEKNHFRFIGKREHDTT